MKQIGLAMHNYHEANNSFPLGASLGNFSTLPGVYFTYAKQGFSALALLLPYMGETAIYNAINFNFGIDESGFGFAGDVMNVQFTAVGSHVKEFVCPSDPNGGRTLTAIARNTNNYYGSVGTSTNQNNRSSTP